MSLKKLLIISITVIVSAVLLYALIHSAFTPVLKPEPVVSVTQQPPTKEELLKLVNVERAKHGVAPLVEDARLDQSAQWKANDEVTFKYFGHVKPGTVGNDGLDYLNSIGNQCVHISENLVHNVDRYTGKDLNNTSKGSVDAWINSPLHHAAMIDAKYSLTGFGISGTEVVEHFCQT